MDELKNLVI
jgi:FGFR1 oncogene partner